MSFITTQTIGTAVASQGITQQPTQVQQNQNIPQSPAEVSRITQAAAVQTTIGQKNEDKSRVTQTPKRVEGKFATQKNKAKPQKAAPQEVQEESSQHPQGEKIDLKV